MKFIKNANVKNTVWGYLRKRRFFIAGIFIIAAAAAVRLYNLDYNTPFTDEAIYIVIGKLGLFEGDWSSYNTQAWMAGFPYLYPSLSALAYSTGGIVASRLLSVLVGVLIVEEIYRFTYFLGLFEPQTNRVAALLAMAFAAFFSIGLHISRLATYDGLSILLLLVAMNALLFARQHATGKYYFIAAVSLLFSVLTKIITGIYFIPLAIISYIQAIHISSLNARFWKIYFFLAFSAGVLIYLAISWRDLFTYASLQAGREFASYELLLSTIWRNTDIFLILAVPSAVALWVARKRLEVAVLVGCAAILPMVHLATHRWSTLDKHTFFIALFLIPLISYGLALLWKNIRSTDLKVGYVGFALVIFLFYMVVEKQLLSELEHAWIDTGEMVEVLLPLVGPEDKVLTEAGAATILALYDKTHPSNVTTLDWIDYRGRNDNQAYAQAVRDGYFNFIELHGRVEAKKDLTEMIRLELPGRYTLVETREPFEIYARIY